MSYGNIGSAFIVFFVGFFITVPFALWKWIDIGIWVWNHIQFGIK